MPLQVPVTQTGLEASIEAAAKKAGRNLKIDLGTNAKSINALSQPLGRITGQADEFTKSMEAANARVFAFGASVGIINGVSKAFGALVKSTIEVEKSLVEINSVLGASSDSLQKFGNKLFDVAKTTGQTFDVVAKGALELARQGLSTEETLKRINDALILSRLSGLDAQQSVEGLTAAFNSFKETGITTSQILNKLVVVSQKYSVSEKDLIEGLKRSASVADQAGVSFDELVGIITTVQERTARGGAVIGNAFKTIFARIQDTGALQDLSNLGIQVTDLEGKILPATKILQNLGAEFNNLSQLEQADIAKKLGGVYQLSNLLAAVKDLSSEQSKYNDIVKLSAGATNEAYQKNAALNETLAALINKVSVSAQQLGATLGAIGITDNLKQLLDFFNKILEGIQGILGEESMLGDMFRGLAKGIGSVLAGPGLALFGAIIAKLSKDLIGFGIESLKSFFKIGQAAKDIERLQGSIASTLLKNKDIQAQILSLEGNRVAQAKFFTAALNEQYSVMQKMQGIAASVAPMVYTGTSGSRGGKAKNSAGGYMPAVSQESRDISRGVGGARGGDKPVVIPNFAFGGGKKGTMVAHTGEYIVPNFAGGGSAIFNRDMVRSMGLPAGAKKIGAAGGFIPNFAEWYNRNTTKVKTSNEMPTTPGDWVRVKSSSDSIRKYSENIDQYRVRDTDFYLFPDGTGSRGNTVRATLGREESKAVTNIKEEQKKVSEAGEFVINANDLGGIAVVSPRFGSGVRELFSRGMVGDYAIFNRGGPEAEIDKNRYITLKGIKGVNTPKPQDVKGLSVDINQMFADRIVDLAYKLYGRTFDPASAGEFGQKLKSLSGKQSLLPPTAEGQIFEAAGKVALNSIQDLDSLFGSTEENRPFDFQNPQALKEFFNISVLRGDAKRGGEANFVTQEGKMATSKKNKGQDMIRKSFNDPEYSLKMLNILKAQGAFNPEMQRKKSAEEVSNAINGFIPNFSKRIPEKIRAGRDFESDVFTKLKLGNPGNRILDIPQGLLQGKREEAKTSMGLEGSFGDVKLSNAKTNKYNFLGKLIKYFNLANYVTSAFKDKGQKEVLLNKKIPSINDATMFFSGNPSLYYPEEVSATLGQILHESRGLDGVQSPVLEAFKSARTKPGDPSSVALQDAFKRKKIIAKINMDGINPYQNTLNDKDPFAKGYIPNFVSQKYVMDTLARIKAGTSGFSKQEQETFLNKFGAKSTGRKISLREVYDKLDGDVGISALIDKAYMAAGPTASNEDVYRIFEKQIKANPYALRGLVSKKGFVPNFADPLKEAISREMSAGVPASQIYVDQNSSLKNSMNPMGLMVANRRDEPGGGMQGVSRARREGANPMMYGASRGFIPNFERRVGAGSRPPASLGGGGGGGSSDVEPVKRDLLGIIFALQTGLSFLTGATADATGGLGKFANTISSIASSASTALLVFEGFKGFAKEGSKASAVLGKLSIVGAVAAGGYEALKQLFSYLDSTNPSIKKTQSAMEGVATAASKASINLENLKPSERAAVESGRKKVFEELGISQGFFTDLGQDFYDLSSNIQNSIVGALGGFRGDTKRINDFVDTAKFEGYGSASRENFTNIVDQANAVGISFKYLGEKLKALKEDGVITGDEIRKFGFDIEELTKKIAGLSTEKVIKDLKLTQESGIGQALTQGTSEEFDKLLNQSRQKGDKGPLGPLQDFLFNAEMTDDAARSNFIKKLREDLLNYQKEEASSEVTRVQTASLSLLKQQLENRIAYKNALFEATSAEEYTLELQKEMLSVGEKDRVAAGYKLQALQDAKKLTLEQEKATLDVLKNSELINKKLESAGISGQIDPTKFKEIAGISEEISDLIKQQGGYTQEVENKAQSLLAPIVKNKEQQDLILSLLKESNNEVEKRLGLESKLNALNNLRAATLEAEKFVNEKRSAAITNEYDQASKKAALDKNALDIELERFKIEKERQKIGGGAGGNLSVDKQILDKEKLTIDAKLKIDQEDLLNQVRKTFAEAALQAGQPEELSAISTATSQKEFEAIATAIEDAEKQAQKLKIDQALEQVRIQNESVINQVTLTQTSAVNFATTVIQAGQQVAGYLGSIAANPFQLFGEEQKPSTSPISAMPPVNQAFEEAKQKLQGVTEGAVKFAEAEKRRIDELGTNFSGLFDVYNNSVIESGQASLEAANSIGNLENALLSAGGSLTTFANLVRGVFTSLPETIAQNQFAMLTATDSQSIIGNAVEARRNAILAQGPASAGTIAQAADASAIYEKELEIKRAITAEDKINGEFELEKLKEILPLRMELLKAETNEEREAIIDRIIAKEKQRLPVLDRIKAAISSTSEQRTAELEDTLVSASVKFRDNLIDGISQAIEGGGSIKDILTSAALDFAREMTKASMKNFVGSIGGFFGFANGGIVPNMASGGMINGGSGSKDDVPAMLMGGEYVLKKTAVEKYGPEFLNAINNGRLNGYANGGVVQDLPVQSGVGGFYTPGDYGRGGIQGRQNLLDFATQTATSGQYDMITGGDNYAAINLEAESMRLTNFGRSRGPAAEALRRAKEESFGLYQQDVEAEKQRREQEKQLAEQAKASRKQFLINLAMTVASAAASSAGNAGIQGAKAGWAANAGKGFGTQLGGAFKGIFSGAQVGGAGPNVGGLGNWFSGVGSAFTGNFKQAGNYFKLSQIGNAEQIGEAMKNKNFADFMSGSGYTPAMQSENAGSIKSNGIFDWARNLFGKKENIDANRFLETGEDIKDPSQWVRGGSSTAYDFNIDNGVLPPLDGAGSSDTLPYLNDSDLSSGVPLNAVPVMSDSGKRAVLNAGNGRRYATGGAIPSTSGVDTIPAMLSGGEFVMNRAASQNIGAGNLQALNAGAGSLPTEEKTEELNDRLVAKLDELIATMTEGTNAGSITINVDSNGKSTQETSGETSESKQKLAAQIKDTVMKVIEQEKRLGGKLRRGL